ncbi:hypothetical protein FOMPIDRAFT_82551 [Fomitopsis schrenkii]|uniref:F-box domain-containing protein n=1 Tax=Fomitopsis schrenkii TaxID=2126942 RepID=S8ECX6_FOMSC|nr:hypothetical protein FOMPIDRAFT_82551 [Fomitopsis schrenkii]
MHHCLNIEEIVEAICEQVFLLQDGPASLLAFGLACYALLEPALDRLWRTQTNLSPLVRVLPADSWTYFGKNIVTLTRPLVREDWKRLDAYALRIRNLGFEHTRALAGQGMRHPVNFAILEAFRAHHEGSPFLPKLQSLRLTTYHLRFVDLLLAPSLTSVSFDFGLCWNTHEEHELLEAVLIDAGARCPYLQEFLVESSRTSASSAGDAALEPFAHLLPMRQYPPSLQAGDIIRLASIPRLQRACFRVSSIADVPSRSQMQHIVAFHSLSDLELHVRSLEIATALLELLQTPCLEALTVHVDNLPEPLTFSAFCVALRSVASPATFHSLKLNGGGTNSPGAGDICAESISNQLERYNTLVSVLARVDL